MPGLQHVYHRLRRYHSQYHPKVGGSVERTCAILRSISDKSKFEVLQRLGAERSYCQKLAEDMNINPGHMSRILMTLFQYGFLTREQEQSRYYYTTNRDSISTFLSGVRQLLVGKPEETRPKPRRRIAPVAKTPGNTHDAQLLTGRRRSCGVLFVQSHLLFFFFYIFQEMG